THPETAAVLTLRVDSAPKLCYNKLYAVHNGTDGALLKRSRTLQTVALESLQPAGRFVRRKWRDGGISPGYGSGYYPLILHRNLAFFRKVCKAVLEKLNMEMYSRGRKREHSKVCS